jgi:enolase-phosphatase E1
LAKLMLPDSWPRHKQLSMLGSHHKAILLDIEGTTTPVEFVYTTLFPFARKRIEEFVRRNYQEEKVLADIALLRQEHNEDLHNGLEPPPWHADPYERQIESIRGYVHWLMDHDRKSTGLKSLEGRIWEEGYRTGELRGEVYPDVRPAFERWTQKGLQINIFSSGSVLAQRLLFGNSTAGDLTRYITGYFDTTTGPKTKAESYELIAAAHDLSAKEVLFVSDTLAELNASKLSGMSTALCVRGPVSDSQEHQHQGIHTFDEIRFA